MVLPDPCPPETETHSVFFLNLSFMMIDNGITILSKNVFFIALEWKELCSISLKRES